MPGCLFSRNGPNSYFLGSSAGFAGAGAAGAPGAGAAGAPGAGAGAGAGAVTAGASFFGSSAFLQARVKVNDTARTRENNNTKALFIT